METDPGASDERPTMYGTPSKKARVSETAVSSASPSDGKHVQQDIDDALVDMEDMANVTLLAHRDCKGQMKELHKEMDSALAEILKTQGFLKSKEGDD